MEEKVLPPHAASLIQSMRDLGYSLETAIADLIDNSITAGSDIIDIFLSITDTDASCMAIIDNGTGMIEDQLLEAMRPGSRDPREKRDVDDLGRFGLGLKTASFSQCKCLTVISRRNQKLCAAQWDLDLISMRNEWIVRILSAEEIIRLPYVDQLGDQGTYVLWQKLDRLLESNLHTPNMNDAYEKLLTVEKHLALVFHRYLSGDYKKWALDIRVNGHSVEAFDPFCISNKATQLLPEEVIRIDAQEIRIQPYILPHHSKLSKKEYEFYSSRSDFVSNQGAYIYRNGRLMAWGDWFRLVPKTEATKLARVRIDFSNALDEQWTIDIKKSRAHPPYQVREKLRQIIYRITEQSRRVHTGRGKRLFEEQEQPLWVRYSDRTGIRYALNRDHPLLTAILNHPDTVTANAFEDILIVVEQSLPIAAIYADYSSSPQSFEEKTETTYDELKGKIQNLYVLLMTSAPVDKESFARMIFGMKPFSENREITRKIIEELV